MAAEYHFFTAETYQTCTMFSPLKRTRPIQVIWSRRSSCHLPEALVIILHRKGCGFCDRKGNNCEFLLLHGLAWCRTHTVIAEMRDRKRRSHAMHARTRRTQARHALRRQRKDWPRLIAGPSGSFHTISSSKQSRQFGRIAAWHDPAHNCCGSNMRCGTEDFEI